MQRRALQIALLVVMAIFLGTMFTPLHVADCATTIDKKSEATVAVNDARLHGDAGDDALVAFQIHGGDNAFDDGLRAAFKDALAKKAPNAKVVDGPPPKNSVLLRVTLTSADLRWTPFYSHEALGAHTAIQLPGMSAGKQITADTNIDAVCKGLVSRAHFQAHGDTTAPLAEWLVDNLAAARAR
ncbi:MAG TPA: hypothetical protein VGO62_04820 [Myxococcota bacterium]